MNQWSLPGDLLLYPLVYLMPNKEKEEIALIESITDLKLFSTNDYTQCSM